MRNPERIDEILAAIGVIWKKYPDQRFFQLISNIPWKNITQDTFFYEDDKVLESLNEFIKKGNNF